jgi:carotenoid cleavage dioxygenase-like enzyme
MTGREEACWTKENHYPTELTFIPAPHATQEDQGVLITIAYDGVR